jgi:glycosyltransferase involved in cell wall biosynthesis
MEAAGRNPKRVMNRALIVWGNWGPYHYARFEALRELAADHGRTVEGIELFPESGIYSWETRSGVAGMHYLDLGTNETAFRPWLLATRLAPLVRRLSPQVVFVPSYWHWSLFLNGVARLAGARIVMMNESHAGTARARGLKQWIKRGIVSSFHAALVGGTPHRRYFSSLGMPAERIFIGYDAVDNDNFRRGAAAARAAAPEHRARLGLPDRYFLSLGRLVAKKNLTLLIDAFAGLAPSPDGTHHHLVFVGSGEEERTIRRRADALGLSFIDHAPGGAVETVAAADQPAVHSYGFRQVAENPVFYGLATAFVLPSLYEEWGLVVNEAMACGLPVLVSQTAGCAEDLVIPGVTGFLFAPDDTGGLRGSLQNLADDPTLAARMGRASFAHIAGWGCRRFAEGALQAWNAAVRT